MSRQGLILPEENKQTDNDQPAVSVCMATYNGERFLAEQLDTIIPQLKPGDELIISDDASTDRTVELLKSYQSPQVRLCLDGDFSGPVGNFEYCLRQARHDVLILADQDDVWLDNRIALIRDKMRGRENTLFALMTDAEFIDATGRLTGETLFSFYRARTGVLRNLGWNCYTGCAMAFTRPLLQKALPFPRGIPMHDAWIGLLADAGGTMELVPERTFRHRRHDANTSGLRWQPTRQIRWRLTLAWHLWQRTCRGTNGR